MSEKSILCVGLVVVDIVTTVNTYPVEDTKSRLVGNPAVMWMVLVGLMVELKQWNDIDNDLLNNCIILIIFRLI